MYPIYTNYYYGRGLDQYDRHMAYVEKSTRFWNPWQYRVLAPAIVEAGYLIYNSTIHRIFDIESYLNSKMGYSDSTQENKAKIQGHIAKNGFVRYNIVFILFRFALNFLIYALLFLQLRTIGVSTLLSSFGVVLSSLLIGNAVNDSDLSFNTYLDVIFYQSAMLVMSANRNQWLIVPITIIGALNRETSMLIPFAYFVANCNLDGSIKKKFNIRDFVRSAMPDSKTLLITAISTIFFLLIFFGIRYSVGYRDYVGWRVPSGFPMLNFNFFSKTSIKTYCEIFAVTTLLPLFGFLYFNKLPKLYSYLMITLVPIWFLVHATMVVIYESRIFLVPTIVVLLPATIVLIQKSLHEDSRESELQASQDT